MTQTPDALGDRIVIASSCSEPWEGMSGDDRVRRCAACRLDVHNIVALTRAEVEQLLDGATGRICARVHRRSDGTVLTADCTPARKQVARRLRRVRLALTSLLALVGLGGCRSESAPTVTTGVVVPLEWQALPQADPSSPADGR